MPTRETVAIVRLRVVDRGAGGNDAVRADRAGLAEDAALHAGDVADCGDARRLVEVAKVVREIAVLVEPAQVALVADIIARIEAHQAWKQPPVRLGLDLATEITLARQPLLQAVQRLEQFFDGAVVGLLLKSNSRSR